MEDYKIVTYRSSHYDVWNGFLASAKNATFLFHRDFMEYHRDRFEDFSLMVYKKEKLMALLPANVSGTTVHSHQGLSYGGLILKDDIKLRDVLDIFYALLEFLNHKNYKELEIKLLPSIYSTLPNDEISYMSFVLDAFLLKRDTFSVINQNEAPKISRNRMEGYKRGKKNGLEIIEETNFELFWNVILIPNLKIKYKTMPVHSLQEITRLKEKFPNNIRQFNVYFQNRIVAGATLFITEKVAHCQYISGDSDSNALGSLDFLFEHLIKKVFVNKPYFDFGASNENNGRHINAGLQFWKEGFGARTITQDFYIISIQKYKNLKTVMV